MAEDGARPQAGRWRPGPVDPPRHPAEPRVPQRELRVRPRLPPGAHVAGEGDLAARLRLFQNLPLFEEREESPAERRAASPGGSRQPRAASGEAARHHAEQVAVRETLRLPSPGRCEA